MRFRFSPDSRPDLSDLTSLEYETMMKFLWSPIDDALLSKLMPWQYDLVIESMEIPVPYDQQTLTFIREITHPCLF